MELRYFQIQVFHSILVLELFLNVFQPELLPLTGIPPEKWPSHLFLLEHFALPGCFFERAALCSLEMKRNDPPDLNYLFSPICICIYNLSFADESTWILYVFHLMGKAPAIGFASHGPQWLERFSLYSCVYYLLLISTFCMNYRSSKMETKLYN